MCWVYSPNIQGRHARWLQTIFEYTMIPTVGCLISRDEWQSSLLWRNSVIWMEATNRSESQDRHLLPNWHWDKSPETEMSVMNVITSHISVSLNCLPGEQKLRLSSKRKRKLLSVGLCAQSTQIQKHKPLMHSSSLKFRRITLEIQSINQRQASWSRLCLSAVVMWALVSSGCCVVKWMSVATNINDRH